MAFNKNNYDFCGYATRFDTVCDDGRVIKYSAFKDQDGKRVTLADNHGHSVGSDTLGYVDLEVRHDGIYCYGSLNNTDKGKNSKESLAHGDIAGLSIWANKLKEVFNPTTKHNEVVHGQIREVSLVMSGCNPGALIDVVNPALAHGMEPPEILDGSDTTIGQIWPYESDFIEVIRHDGTENKEETKVAEENTKPKPSESEDEDVEIVDPQATWDSMKPDQQQLVKNLVGNLIAKYEKEGTEEMPKSGTVSHNAFMNDEMTYDGAALAHDAFSEIVAGGKANGGSVKDFFLAHSDDISKEYGIQNIGDLLDDYHAQNTTPEKIRDTDLTWVNKVADNVTTTMFSRMKIRYVDMRDEEDMKARGYITTHRKKETVIKLLKRVTSPWTMYIKSKMDRDELIDIEESGLDYVPFVKDEMDERLTELKAKCYLLGDGLSSGDEDHVPEDCIRPIVSDDALYSRKYILQVSSTADEDEIAKAFIRFIRKKYRFYRGSGSPVLFVPEDLLSDMLNIEDTNQHLLYEDIDKLCRTLRVKEIIPTPPMEGATMTDNDPDSDTNGETANLAGIMVNMKDYVVGMNKLGKKSMFEDFDINYNQMVWLLETRQAGCLMKPFSALVFGIQQA